MGIVKYVPMSIRNELLSLEEEGRKLASRRDEEPGYDDQDFLSRLQDTLDSELISGEYLDKEQEEYALRLIDAIRSLDNTAAFCEKRRIKRGQCLTHIQDEEKIRMVDEMAKKIFGKKCTWLLGEQKLYTYSAALNDLTACFHRLVDNIELESRRDYRVRGKCYIRYDANPRLAEACEKWDRVTEEMDDKPGGLGLYSDEDYLALECNIKDNKAECRVGSAEGHKTHIDLDKDTLEYYDRDENVNETMKKLWEELGMKCELRRDGVTCKGVKDKLDQAFERLACATSMDYRLKYDLEDYRSRAGRRPKLQPIVEKCKTNGDVDEACVCKLAIESAKSG